MGTWMGATVRGPQHQRERRANDDAWLGVDGPYGSLIVVCDGMGSRPHGGAGARDACRSVRRVVGLWGGDGDTDVTVLLRMVPLWWSLAVRPRPTSDCATTCLFAALTPARRLIVAQLGDGLAVLRMPDGELRRVSTSREGFGNETTALGVAHRLDEWTWLDLPAAPQGTTVLLATDGLADDLLPDRVGKLVAQLVADYGSLSRRVANAALRRMLTDYPTPRHLDDKTLALLW